MPVKKSELYSSIWKSCDELRGGMDASQYKDYILVLLFIKYISDKYSNTPYASITIPEGASFKDLVKLKGKPTIGDDINKKIIAKIAAANKLTGTIDVADFNSAEKLGKGDELVNRLTKLIAIFENPALDFTKNRAEGDDLLGDAYEYLMRNFATQSGKSKGQFYTPAEVSRVMAKVLGINDKTVTASTMVSDPTCGSGSLLLKVADESEKNISLYGQEMDVATAALARMNMVLHNHASDVQTIQQGNTLADPKFLDDKGRLKTFDFVVANFPFSYKSWSTGLTNDKGAVYDKFERFDGFGIPPMKNGDYAFLLHAIRTLNRKGKGAIILPHGVLFRGNAEAEIRENIIRRGYIKGVIGLPSNLFFGTGIPACIIVIDKENADNRKGIFMIDASKGFIKDGNKNRLRHQDIHKIVDVFNTQTEIPKYSKTVPFTEIEANEYNLNIPRYIDSQEDEDIQDIEAHLMGGIPKNDVDAMLNYWSAFPSLRKTLFAKNERDGYFNIKADPLEIKNIIYNHPEFVEFTKTIDAVFSDWKSRTTKELNKIVVGTKPKLLIHTISEEILKSFSKLNLIDKYDLYQHLMTYWTETIQDDLYLIASEGWKVDFYFDATLKEYVCDLIPKELVINRYFKKEKEEIEQLEVDKDTVVSQMEELYEEHSGDEGLLEDVKTEKGKVTKALLQKRLKEIAEENNKVKKAAEPKVKYVVEDDDEELVLRKYLSLIVSEAEIKKQIKEAEEKLLERLKNKYKTLTEAEIKVLVIDDKWMTAIYKDVKSEVDRISQRLTQRLKELAERYDKTLPILDKDVRGLENKVNAHLKKMGFEWK